MSELHGGLRDVLPTARDVLGIADESSESVYISRREQWSLPSTQRVCVVLVDGLGMHPLRNRSGHAPFLKKFLDGAYTLESDFPSTTATSMGSFGTGLPPGQHGLLGYLVHDRDSGITLNELAWDAEIDPVAWQNRETLFENLVRHDVACYQIGPGHFHGSGLTQAALRGATFVAANSLQQRVDAAVDVLKRSKPVLAYLYWGDIDKIGHIVGCESYEWSEELTRVDSALRDLTQRIPPDTLLLITADHGMVDIARSSFYDVTHMSALNEGVDTIAGEPRAVMLFTADGQAERVAARWKEEFGDKVRVSTQDDALRDHLFGAVDSSKLSRVPDVVVDVVGDIAIVHRGYMAGEWAKLVGLHGSTSDAETQIPLLVVPPRR